MEIVHLGPMCHIISMPTEANLEANIQRFKEDAALHPSHAEYDQLEEKIFKTDLAILNDPKNRDLQASTLSNAENLDEQMDAATGGFQQRAASILRQDCENGDTSLLNLGFLTSSQAWCVPVN